MLDRMIREGILKEDTWEKNEVSKKQGEELGAAFPGSASAKDF